MREFLRFRFLFIFLFVFLFVFLFGFWVVGDLCAQSSSKGLGDRDFKERYRSYVYSCIMSASSKYRVHPGIIESIIIVESGFNPYAINYNRNGSYDIGIMQINSSWFSLLRRYGISPRDLYNPCVNIDVGTWILARCIAKHGYTWEAIGCYNAVSSEKRKRYAYKVYKVFLTKSTLAKAVRGNYVNQYRQ